MTEFIRWGEQARVRAVTDSFTGLLNRRYFEDSIERILIDAQRDKINVSFAMVDIDRFGTLNRTYGPEFCDKILLAIVDVFKKSFDNDDVLIRIGGDEFCFIIRGEFDRNIAQCQRVCKEVNELIFLEHLDLRVSCSIGLYNYSEGLTSSDLMKRADEELYKAKEAGRNRVHYSR